MNKYVAFFNRKQVEVQAPTSYAAQQQAAALFKAGRKTYMVSVVLVEKGGDAVSFSPNSLPGA